MICELGTGYCVQTLYLGCFSLLIISFAKVST